MSSAPFSWSPTQRDVLDQVRAHQSVLVTGPGGTGKTALIRELARQERAHGRQVQVCAMTGCAAVVLDCHARTVHSWAGIGRGDTPVEVLLPKLRKNALTRNAWTRTDVWIVDEVSMLSQPLLELLDDLGRALRGHPELPFGGLQVVFSGDFYQLAPVGSGLDARCCCQSDRWATLFPPDHRVELTTLFRQPDPVFQQLLLRVREGRVTPEDNLQWQTRLRPVPDDVLAPCLFPRRLQVDQVNADRLARLDGPEWVWRATPVTCRRTSSAAQVSTERDALMARLPCPEVLRLKRGAQVMCVINAPRRGLFNGLQGVVTGRALSGAPCVRFPGVPGDVAMEPHAWMSDRVPDAGVQHIPLVLSWAMTIHKAQGVTLEAAEMDAGSGIFACGQTYVALSRVRTWEGLYLSGWDPAQIRVPSWASTA
jgi:ATP-dependent DNA helicase PIF1